jgi:adenylate kinase family enzyme
MDTYIHQHGGLGDMILCNGLIRYLLQNKDKKDKIYIFCRSRYLKSVKFMYRDEKRIKIISFNENLNLKDEKLLAKFETNKAEKIVDKIKLNKKIDFIKIGFENYHKTRNVEL